jgi:hypothetical protein
MLTWLITGIALAAIVYLVMILAARIASDRIQQFMDRRRASSRLVSRGELIDGNRHLPVALALGAVSNRELNRADDDGWPIQAVAERAAS